LVELRDNRFQERQNSGGRRMIDETIEKVIEPCALSFDLSTIPISQFCDNKFIFEQISWDPK
jgi:hypothetical protein